MIKNRNIAISAFSHIGASLNIIYIHISSLRVCAHDDYRSWIVSNVKEDTACRQSPPTVGKSVVKSRNSTIRREDQQLYDNAVGE